MVEFPGCPKLGEGCTGVGGDCGWKVGDSGDNDTFSPAAVVKIDEVFVVLMPLTTRRGGNEGASGLPE